MQPCTFRAGEVGHPAVTRFHTGERERGSSHGEVSARAVGHPGGRPKGSVTSLWRQLNAEVDAEEEGRTRAEVLYHRAYGEAKRGNINAIALILDRTEGKPRQPVSLTVERREQLEQAIRGIMRDAEAAGSPCTREEAIATLASFMPEASELLH